tara:strand:+ start:1787 stop:2077 length:291 start_codon:yes stop_codon:yes gene_type:complete
MFPADSLCLKGKVGEFKYKSSTGSEVTKGFCLGCGSPIFGKNTRSPNYVTLPLGTMDDAEGLTVQVVVFARDKQHWDQLADGVASFETLPDWQPES